MQNQPPPLSDDLARLIDAQVLKSEQRRGKALLVLTVVLLGILLLVSLIPGALPKGNEATLRPALKAFGFLLMALGSYEAVVAAWLKRRQQRAPSVIRLLSACIEIGIVTMIICDWSAVAGPVATVGGALPWLYFPFIAVSALHLDQRHCWFTGALAGLGFLFVAWWVTRPLALQEVPLVMSRTSFVLKSSLLLISGGVAAFVASQLKAHLHHAVQSARERDRAIGIFGQHVSPQVARRLIEQTAAQSAEQRHVCVLFLDIRSFSTFAAQRTPSEVMDYLNTLFAPMITIVNQHGGIVNKFLGDGFMAIFGAPFEDPELHRNAVHCSLKLLRCVEELNTAAAIPTTRIGIGLHAGDAMAGTVGSTERKEYTLLGDTVNAAARIEQETKKLGAQIIASDAVMEGLAEEKARATELGEISLRGISTPLRLYQLA